MKKHVLNNLQKLDYRLKKSLPMIRQSEAAECSLACLTMISSYHGFNITMTTMRKKVSLSLRGASLQNLIDYADKFSLSSRVLKLDIDRLSELQAPCILHWDMNHFVVLKKATNKYITVHDPSRGVLKLTYAEVSKSFTGIALELIPTENFVLKEKAPSLNFHHFWDKIKGLKSSLVIIFTLSVILQLFGLIAPYYLQLVIDKVIYSSDENLLLTIFIGFFLVVFMEAITGYMRGLSLIHLSNSFNLQLGSNLFHHLIRLPVAYFESRHMGDILSRFGSLSNIKEQMTQGIIEALLDGLMALLILFLLFIYSPTLTTIVVTTILIYAAFRMFMFKKYRKVNEDELNALAYEETSFMETIRGINTIKLFNAENKRESTWQNFQAESINQNIKMGNYQNLFTTSQSLLFNIENLVVIYFAALAVMDNTFSLGMLFAYVAYKRQFSTKVANLIQKIVEFKMLGLHFERLADIALTQKEASFSSDSSESSLLGSIEIKNLCFGYDSSAPQIIKDVSFKIFAGESVSIIGSSGCGKSTLLKLMLGLRAPSSGQILIDDVPIEKFGIRHFRDQIAAIMQDDSIFSGSIYDNIALFDSNSNEESVIESAKMAELHEDISRMPMGYNSLIGDMGSVLSGGQKQRLILARALYKKPKIIFMDEATSHLDEELEELINQTIKNLKITRVIIAHRANTIASTERQIHLPSINKAK